MTCDVELWANTDEAVSVWCRSCDVEIVAKTGLSFEELVQAVTKHRRLAEKTRLFALRYGDPKPDPLKRLSGRLSFTEDELRERFVMDMEMTREQLLARLSTFGH